MTDIGMLGIPGADTWRRIEPVLKGWSGDKKYYIEDNAGTKLLLRLSEASTLERKTAEFAVIRKFNRLNFPMSQALRMGTCADGQVYMLLTWVEGIPLEDCLTGLPDQEQYRLGAEAGGFLREIHGIRSDKDLSGWEAAMQAKILRRIKEYEDCPYRLENDSVAIGYVQENIGLIHNVEKVYHHGDFHAGNLLYTPAGGIGVIDFNRWDIADYAEEFYKVQFFDRKLSIPFAKGKLEGYFAGPPPESFWQRQVLYVAYSSLFQSNGRFPSGKQRFRG